jgi:orotate phosphoribosyltransferase-like protein
MKIVNRPIGALRYPVGERMTENFSIIDEMCVHLRELLEAEYAGIKNVHFLCRGSSGAILAAIVGRYIYMNTDRVIHIDHFKKEGENSHNHNRFDEKLLFNDSVVVIIDDIVCTGQTVDAILCDVNKFTSLYPHILCVSGDIKKSLMTDWKFQHVLCEEIS